MTVNALDTLPEKPPVVITRANSTVVHRAGAWRRVEIAQRLLNEAVLDALQKLPPESLAFPQLMRAYQQFERARAAFVLRVPLASTTGPLARTLAAAQAGVTAAARASCLFTAQCAELDDARAYYLSIGGAEDREPGEGGEGMLS